MATEEITNQEATVKSRCSSCWGQGIRQGSDGTQGFICRYCRGLGYVEIKYIPFERLIRVEGVQEVLGRFDSFSTVGEVDKVTYTEYFEQGKIPRISEEKRGLNKAMGEAGDDQ